MEKLKILNAWQIKLIMVMLMTLDHLRYIQNLVPSDTAFIFIIISRCVAPMFAYFAVEGIRYTRDLKKYCLRLCTLAGIMFAGNAILNQIFKIFSETVLETELRFLYTNNNIVFTLAAGVLAISFIVWSEKKEKRFVFCLLAVVCFAIGFLFGEWGTVLLPFMTVTYLFREKKIYRYAGYAVTQVISILISFSEPLWFIVFPFILVYNGKRGTNTFFSKYFFYVFYPLHLWIIALINFYVMTK